MLQQEKARPQSTALFGLRTNKMGVFFGSVQLIL